MFYDSENAQYAARLDGTLVARSALDQFGFGGCFASGSAVVQSLGLVPCLNMAPMYQLGMVGRGLSLAVAVDLVVWIFFKPLAGMRAWAMGRERPGAL